MPFRSRSQVRKFGAMVKRGEMSQAKFRQWLNETPSVKRLPERVNKKGQDTARKTRAKGRR